MRRRLWTAALAVLAASAVLIALAVVRGGGQDAAEPPSAREVPPPPAATSADEAQPSGELTAGGRSLLPPTPGLLGEVVGERARGERVTVTDVTRRGFFVGPSGVERVYVHWPGEPPPIRSRVELTGVVRAAPDDPRALLLEAEDAEIVADHGGYVEGRKVRTAAEGDG